MPHLPRRAARGVLPLTLGVVALGLAAACSQGSDGLTAPSATRLPGSPPAVSAAPTGGATTAPGGATTAPGRVDFTTPREVSTGLDAPWGLAFLPGGDALIGQRDDGQLMRVPAGGGDPQPAGKVEGVRSGGEGGLLGLAVSPTFAADKMVYAYFTADRENRVVRFPLDDPSRQQVVIDGIDRAGIHNGGRIAFGPDGMLYASTGDAGDKGESQDRGDLNGKILRVAPDGAIPADNPFSGSPVWSLGHRNVQGLAWDSSKRLYASEFGQNTFDEVNLIEPGNNYGWPVVEGMGDTKGGEFTQPLLTWQPEEASPSGAAVVGDDLFVAALRGRRVWQVPLDGQGGVREPVPQLKGELGRVRTVAAAPDGSLWVVTSNTDGRGQTRDGDDRILRFPAG